MCSPKISLNPVDWYHNMDMFGDLSFGDLRKDLLPKKPKLPRPPPPLAPPPTPPKASVAVLAPNVRSEHTRRSAARLGTNQFVIPLRNDLNVA